jgi:hypothetical protein
VLMVLLVPGVRTVEPIGPSWAGANRVTVRV